MTIAQTIEVIYGLIRDARWLCTVGNFPITGC